MLMLIEINDFSLRFNEELIAKGYDRYGKINK